MKESGFVWRPGGRGPSTPMHFSVWALARETYLTENEPALAPEGSFVRSRFFLPLVPRV